VDEEVEHKAKGEVRAVSRFATEKVSLTMSVVKSGPSKIAKTA
jgi:hypothetical protein